VRLLDSFTIHVKINFAGRVKNIPFSSDELLKGMLLNTCPSRAEEQPCDAC
jgi:hypothetical protein